MTSDIVLATTALIILWYTLETARLRRDAEARSARETQLIVLFAIVNPRRPDGFPQLLAHGATPQDAYVLRSWVKNESPNSGIGRLRVRLALAGRVAIATEDAYNGTRDWEVGPYFRLSGVFSLSALVRAVLPENQRQQWPSEGMTLAAQLDLYDSATRKRAWSASKEYFVRYREGTFEFWPHISAEALPPLEVMDRLPPRSR